jgi:hypothetical protein
LAIPLSSAAAGGHSGSSKSGCVGSPWLVGEARSVGEVDIATSEMDIAVVPAFGVP